MPVESITSCAGSLTIAHAQQLARRGAGARIAAHRGNDALDELGRQHDVGIEAEIELGGGGGDQAVVRGGEPEVAVGAETFVRRRDGLQPLARVVSRGVVEDAQRQRAIRLRPHGRDARLDDVRGIPGDDANGDGHERGVGRS